MEERCHFHELQQPQFTYESKVVRSRIDRIYANNYIADQLDRHYACTALPWTPLSSHRPVSFSRCKPTHKHNNPSTLPQAPLQHRDWARRVALDFHAAACDDPMGDDPIRRLILSKRATQSVTKRMWKENIIAQAKEIDDKLGWTMSFIRAAEAVNLSRMAPCAQACPHLTSFVNPADPNARLRAKFAALRLHAVELARSAITEKVTQLHRLGKDDPNSPGCRQIKEHILVSLKRTLPGATATIHAMETDTNVVTTDPAEVAQALPAHWGKVFNGARIDERKISKWLSTLPHFQKQSSGDEPCAQKPELDCYENREGPQRELINKRRRCHDARQDVTPPSAGSPRPTLPTDPEACQVAEEDIAQALELSGNTAPGPDGIPYKAWRALGNLGVDVLHGAAQALAQTTAQDTLKAAYHDEGDDYQHLYNFSTLICLPKKVAGEDQQAGEYYSPEGTRPLSVVNTDSRIVTNAARLRWESMLRHWVSDNQQGFIQGRSILANLLSLDTTAMQTALDSPNGAIVLLDFRAAFPSISQQYLLGTLRAAGLPENVLNIVTYFYDNNHCQIRFEGALYPGFTMTSGVRQGCPLSPLLYALAADALLEKICTTLQGYGPEPTRTTPRWYSTTSGAKRPLWRTFLTPSPV